MIYLASPYSHPDHAVEIKRFEDVCKVAGNMILAGHMVFSPIAHSHPIRELNPKILGNFEFWDTWNAYMIKACSELWVLKLDGWDFSAGIRDEMRKFLLQRKPIYPINPKDWL